MRTILIAAASALLLAYFVTEATSRFWPNDFLALLVTAAVALFVNGIFNVRLAARAKPQPAARNNRSGGNNASADKPKNNRNNRNNRNSQGGGRNNDKRERNNRSNDRPSDRDGNRSDNRGNRDNRERAPRPEKAPTSAPAATGPTEDGEVKWFNRSKGYGFIIRENGEEIFVHQRSIVGADDGRQRLALRDGQMVRFVVTKQDKGDQAEQVQPLD